MLKKYFVFVLSLAALLFGACNNLEVKEANADLSALTVSVGALDPAFSPAITEYRVELPNIVSSITVTGVSAKSSSVVGGQSGQPVSLNVGENTISILVTAENGTTQKTYSVTVHRAEPDSANALLYDMVLDTGTLTPAFSPDIESYAVSVGYAVTSITITGTAEDLAASVGGQSGTPISLNVGENTIVISVTAENGTTVKNYTVTVTRAAPSANANLASLTVSQGTLSPAFSSSTLSYAVYVANAVTGITVTGIAADPTASVGGQSGTPVALSVGDNPISLVVTAQDGVTQKTYTVTVYRADPTVPGGLTIDHTNFDPSSLSDAEILAAAALKVVFEHASTGQDIVGDSDSDCSAGENYDNSESCGLKELYDADSRYNFDRISLSEHESLNADWFSSHSGLQSWRRNNPPPATKLSLFLGMDSDVLAAVDVAMYKYCWIDVYSAAEDYITDGAGYAASEIAQREAFEAGNPGVVMPYWTMPLQSDQAYAARDAYNEAIRAYCAANGKWLIDMADIENYAVNGTKVADIDGHDAAASAYTLSDGGHLSSTGRLRMAKAYWRLLAEIAKR